MSEREDIVQRLLASETNGSVTDTLRAEWAYRAADAMLRERERTNLDAEPAAKVAEPESSVPLGSECGTGNTQNDAVPAADGDGSLHHEGSRVRASATPTGNTHEPVAWAAINDDGDIAWLAYTEEAAADGSAGRPIVPLYRQPPTCPYVVGRTTLHCSLTPLTLTDEEREAIGYFAAAAGPEYLEATNHYAATLRALLKRLG